MNGVAQAIRDSIDVQAELAKPRVGSGTRALAASTIGCSLVFLSGSVINVALPAIRNGLHLSSADVQWTLNAELLPLAAVSMTGGALGDRYGRRKVFLVGAALFLFASLLAGFSDGVSTMLAGRFLQGLAEALILPNGLSIVGQAYSLDRKSRAIGIWSGGIAVISAVGPAIAGILLGHFDWRVAFFINAPLAVLGLLMAWFWVPRDGGQESGSIDIGAAILSIIALGCLGWSLTGASNRSGVSPAVISGFAFCIVALILLVQLERRRGDRAMLPPPLFGSRTLMGINLYTALLFGAFAILLTMIPYTMIRGSGLPASVAGIAFIPLQVLMAAISPLAPVVCARIGHRTPLAVGAIVTAAGCALMLRITPGMDYWLGYFPPILIISVGMSFAVAPLTTLVLTSVDDKYVGIASGLNGAVSRAGPLVAIALLGGLLSGAGQVSISHMHTAMLCCAIACLASAAAIQILVPNPFKT